MSLIYPQISEQIPDHLRPVLDREYIDPYIDDYLVPLQTRWRKFGYVILNEFIPFELLDAYSKRWLADRPCNPHEPGHRSWKPNTPFTHIDEIKNLCLFPPLVEALRSLLFHDMALNLNLINWTSTERNFHQDDYLNPEYVNSYYAAVWIALADIHPDSGPFEFIPGSHRWPAIRRSKVFAYAPQEMKDRPDWNENWPAITEPFVVQAIEEMHRKFGGEIKQFVPKKGDVLIWAGLLTHRGSVPKVRGMERRALIAHYSSVDHRPDMPAPIQWKEPPWGKYFNFK